MIFSTLGAAIIDSSGWQTCYRVWVLITLVLGVPLSLHFPTRGKTFFLNKCFCNNSIFQSTSLHEGRQQKMPIFLPITIYLLVIIHNFPYFLMQKFHFWHFLFLQKASFLVRIPRKFYVRFPFAPIPEVFILRFIKIMVINPCMI